MFHTCLTYVEMLLYLCNFFFDIDYFTLCEEDLDWLFASYLDWNRRKASLKKISFSIHLFDVNFLWNIIHENIQLYNKYKCNGT